MHRIISLERTYKIIWSSCQSHTQILSLGKTVEDAESCNHCSCLIYCGWFGICNWSETIMLLNCNYLAFTEGKRKCLRESLLRKKKRPTTRNKRGLRLQPHILWFQVKMWNLIAHIFIHRRIVLMRVLMGGWWMAFFFTRDVSFVPFFFFLNKLCQISLCNIHQRGEIPRE